MEDASSLDVLSRLIEVTKLPNEAALAVFLEISPQAIYQARKKGLVPHSWAIKVAENYGVSLDWLILGRGSMKDRKYELMPLPTFSRRVGLGAKTIELEEAPISSRSSYVDRDVLALERRVAELENKNKLLEDALAAKTDALEAYKELLKITRANLTEAVAGERPTTTTGVPGSAPSVPSINLANDED